MIQLIPQICTLLQNILNILQNGIYLLSESQDSTQMFNRQQVLAYLQISESTYKRKVAKGELTPMKTPGGDRFYFPDLLQQLKESKRRGRI
jgi:hypothetical protein